MTTIAEIVIQQVLVNGFQAIRQQPEYIDMIFNNLRQEDVQALKDMFNNMSVSIQLGYQRQKISLPCVLILLGGEEEVDTALGRFLGKGKRPYDVHYDYEDSNPGSNIHKDFFFGTDRLNSGRERIGDARKLFQPDDKVKERFGSTFTTSYALRTITEDPLETIFIYNLLKFIMLDSILVFEKNGLINMGLSGSDLNPNEVTMPDISFERILNVSFSNTFDFFYGFGDISKFQINMDAVSIRVNPKHPCHNLAGIPYPQNDIPIVSYGIDSYTIKGQPLSVTDMEPNSIVLNTESYVVIEGTNIDKDAEVEFLDLPFVELRSGGFAGIREISRDYVEDNYLRLKLKGYSVGVTRVKFKNPDTSEATWEAFYVTT